MTAKPSLISRAGANFMSYKYTITWGSVVGDIEGETVVTTLSGMMRYLREAFNADIVQCADIADRCFDEVVTTTIGDKWVRVEKEG